MALLEKIQKQPEHIKKIILWSVVIIVTLALFFIWLRSIKIKFKNFQKEQLFENIGVPELNEKLNEMPKIEFPEIDLPKVSDEELEKIEENMKEVEE